MSNGRLCSTVLHFDLPISARGIEGVWKIRNRVRPFVLLVSNSKVSRKIISRQILEACPKAQVEECPNSNTAMNYVSRYGSEMFDFVFVDYEIKSAKKFIGGGVHLCTKLRLFARKATIIGMTSDDLGLSMSDFLLNGADLVFSKPVCPKIIAHLFSSHDIN